MDNLPEPEFSDFLLPPERDSFRRRFIAAVEQHPIKINGLIETGFWLLLFYSIFDVLYAPHGFTAQLVWYLTIAPHEIGHLICMPFGTFLYIAGGSIWQVLFWVLIGVYSLLVNKQITLPLIFWAIAGHSFINMAIYIGDAQARQLPLLFGMGPEHHDWYNLLQPLGLLHYDHFFAVLAGLFGVLILFAVIAAGIITAWMIPRTSFRRARFGKNTKPLFF